MTAIEERILVPESTDQFLWIVIIGVIGAFFAAFGIGANDVANAFATSVGAKAITLRQAILVAAIFEFLGAFLLGSHVTTTIRSGIAEVSGVEMHDPEDILHANMSLVHPPAKGSIVERRKRMCCSGETSVEVPTHPKK